MVAKSDASSSRLSLILFTLNVAVLIILGLTNIVRSNDLNKINSVIIAVKENRAKTDDVCDRLSRLETRYQIEVTDIKNKLFDIKAETKLSAAKTDEVLKLLKSGRQN